MRQMAAIYLASADDIAGYTDDYVKAALLVWAAFEALALALVIFAAIYAAWSPIIAWRYPELTPSLAVFTWPGSKRSKRTFRTPRSARRRAARCRHA